MSLAHRVLPVAWMFLVVLGPWTRVARAQLAPTGDHYGGQASDTGFGGGATGTGGYAAAVPLDLEPARGDVQVPVSVTYGGRGVGAAGLNWDIPLSYIRVDRSLAHRRPLNFVFFVESRERASLSIGGQTLELVPQDFHQSFPGQTFALQGQTFVGRRDGQQWITRRRFDLDAEGSTWLAYDALGRTYTFTSVWTDPSGNVIDLAGIGLFLLKEVSGPGGRMEIDYDVRSVPLPGVGAPTGFAINLVGVRYNDHPGSNVFKDEIRLGYNAPATTPLSIAAQGTGFVVRMSTLKEIDVFRRGPNGSELQRTYAFGYLRDGDPDTQLPRLETVTMGGRTGTSEAPVTIPVASYRYGSATTKDASGANEIIYQYTQSVATPSLPQGTIAQSEKVGAAGTPGATGFGTTFIMADVTGDGRPDVLFNNPGVGGQLFWSPNQAGPGSSIQFGSGGPIRLLDDLSAAVEESDLSAPRFNYNGVLDAGTQDVWRQLIDVNGDGRLDVIDARASGPGKWSIWINTPRGSAEDLPEDEPHYVRRVVDVRSLIDNLRSEGFDVPDFLPITRRVSKPLVRHRRCYVFGGGWQPYDGVLPLLPCTETPDENSNIIVGAETSFVEWTLADVNGDGHPDFVHNSSPARVAATEHLPSDDLANQRAADGFIDEELQLAAGDGNRVFVQYNTLGMELSGSQPSEPFAGDIDLLGRGSACGIEKWSSFIDKLDKTSQIRLCALQDVNGDGLLDRIESFTAYLSSGNGISGVTVDLPGSGAGHFNPQVPACGAINVHDATYGGNIGEGFFGNATLTFKKNCDGLRACEVAISRQGLGVTVPEGQIGDMTVNYTCGGVDPLLHTLHVGAPATGFTFRLECGSAPADTTFTTTSRAALLDVTGDGIPDYVTSDGIGQAVAIGTGTGFRPAVHVELPVGASLGATAETERCGGSTSATFQGMWDIDGDGKPDVLVRNAGGIDVYQLQPGEQRRADAGRLVEVANGYGARTLLRYRSAKEDGTTAHKVPFAEIVLDEEETVGLPDAAGAVPELAQLTKYAYGNVEMMYDPEREGFVSTGYARTVALRETPNGEAVAMVRDSIGRPGLPADDPRTAFARFLLVGRPTDVTALSGDLGSDAAPLLTVDVSSDPRRFAQSHTEYATRLFTGPTTSDGACQDLFFPYFWEASRGFGIFNYDPCASYGFVSVSAAETTRGAAEPNLVRTRVEVNAVDDFGRPTSITNRNDVNDANDDVCATTTYAGLTALDPLNASPRALATPAQRTLTDCAGKTLFSESYEYHSQQPSQAQLANARVTGYSVVDYDLAHATPLASIRVFDATYDDFGNVLTMTTSRPDGASTLSRTTSLGYDDYALVPLSITTTATGVPDMTVSIEADPVTLEVVGLTDVNRTRWGAIYDGLGRPIVATVTPPGGAAGALSCASYLGFEGNSTAGRQVRRTELTDAIPFDPHHPELACVGAGRTVTVSLDEVGRPKEAALSLGADYHGETLVAAHREYDTFGRVAFEADPSPASQGTATAYGTTRFYKGDGTPDCFVRATGRQSQVARATDEANQIYPTCFTRTYSNHVEIDDVQGPDGLLRHSPQDGVTHRSVATAIGRVTSRQTFEPGNREDAMELHYDRLGHLQATLRGFQPIVTLTQFSYDSLGRTIFTSESETATRTRTYSAWGELLEEDDGAAGTAHRSIRRYDALGRLIHTEENVNGQIEPDTATDFTYDLPAATPLALAQDNMMGRLSTATSSSGSVFYGYDAQGRVNSRTFTSTDDDKAGFTYVERRVFHGDGSLQALHFNLPDDGNLDERIDYAYDSAGRARSVTSVAGLTSEPLFHATAIDALGRVRQAQYGSSIGYTAHFAESGRQLLDDVQITSPGMPTREISYGVADPLGRETRRDERLGGQDTMTLSTYNALGQLALSQRFLNGQMFSAALFRYDMNGNLRSQGDSFGAGIHDLALGYRTSDTSGIDLDRVSRIEYGTSTLQGGDPNVTYDGNGAITSMPTRDAGLRHLTYYANGNVATIGDDNGNSAHFRYDAFGAVQGLDLQSSDAALERHERRFGDLIEHRTLVDNSPIIIPGPCAGCDDPPPPEPSQIVRRVPGPTGLLATRHGAGGSWIFPFGEERGNRVFLDASGASVEDVDYRPFGEATSTGAKPNASLYGREQWNGGDALEAFGLVHLGARLYDPVLGRFLAKDPLFVPRTGSTTNPYAFAGNDPVNGHDPTGLDDEAPGCIGVECTGGDGGGSGGGGAGGGGGQDPWSWCGSDASCAFSFNPSQLYEMGSQAASREFLGISSPMPWLPMSGDQRAWLRGFNDRLEHLVDTAVYARARSRADAWIKGQLAMAGGITIVGAIEVTGFGAMWTAIGTLGLETLEEVGIGIGLGELNIYALSRWARFMEWMKAVRFRGGLGGAAEEGVGEGAAVAGGRILVRQFGRGGQTYGVIRLAFQRDAEIAVMNGAERGVAEGYKGLAEHAFGTARQFAGERHIGFTVLRGRGIDPVVGAYPGSIFVEAVPGGFDLLVQSDIPMVLDALRAAGFGRGTTVKLLINDGTVISRLL